MELLETMDTVARQEWLDPASDSVKRARDDTLHAVARRIQPLLAGDGVHRLQQFHCPLHLVLARVAPSTRGRAPFPHTAQERLTASGEGFRRNAVSQLWINPR